MSLLNQCHAILGPGGVLTGEQVSNRSASWGGGPCQAAAILRPRDTAEVAAVVAHCHAAGQALVTQGGKTGKVSGCVANPGEFALSLERMNQILSVDASTRTLKVQAGTTLQHAQEAAGATDLLLALDLGARGSATIGGNIATNAGGNRVIRYGMMRQQVLGLEVVLADGSILRNTTTLLKDNAGFDLKHLFIGSEGTLGIITQATLRLMPRPSSRATVLAAAGTLSQVQALLSLVERRMGEQLSAFEVMWQSYYQLATSADPLGRQPPLPIDHPYYVLLETEGFNPNADEARIMEVLGEAIETEVLDEVLMAQSLTQRAHFWAIRENVSAYQRWRPVFSYDISLPITAIEPYVDTLLGALSRRWPEARSALFGHLGDGNIHLAISVGDGSDAVHRAIDELVYRGLEAPGGSISAEHGIGLDKRAYLHYSRSPEEIALMRSLKSTLDPTNILNPGKVLSPT